MLAIFANDLACGMWLLFTFLTIWIAPAAGTLSLSLPDVSLPSKTKINLTWTRGVEDPDHFSLQTLPPSEILSNNVVQTNGALSGSVDVVFGNVGPFVLQAYDDSNHLLLTTNSFTVELPPVFNSSTIFSQIRTVTTTASSTSVTVTTSTQTESGTSTDSATSTPSASRAAASKVNVNAIIIGCVLGAIILLLIIIVILFWRKRRADQETRRFSFHRSMMIRPGEINSAFVTGVPDHHRPGGGDTAPGYSDANISDPVARVVSPAANQFPQRSRPAYGYSPTIPVNAQIQPVNAPYPTRLQPYMESSSATPMMISRKDSRYPTTIDMHYDYMHAPSPSHLKPQPPQLNTRQLPPQLPEDGELLTAATSVSTNSVEMRMKMRDGIEKMRAQRVSLLPIEESRNKPVPPTPTR